MKNNEKFENFLEKFWEMINSKESDDWYYGIWINKYMEMDSVRLQRDAPLWDFEECNIGLFPYSQ